MLHARVIIIARSPQAGSIIISAGVGFIRFTIILIICLGVLNWPLVPDVESLDNKYS